MKQYITIVSLLILTILTPGFGQWYYSLYLEQEYNSNPFGVPAPESDQISKISMGLQKDWEYLSAQYFGSYIGYKEYSDRNLYWHQLNIAGGDSLSWSLTAENRLNREEYNVYNYWTIRGGGVKSAISHHILWRLGGNVSLNHLLELPDLNNLLFVAYASVNRSFSTRTSFNGTVAFNYKFYLEQYSTSLPGDSLMIPLLSVNGIYQGGGPGSGQGGGGNMGSGPIYTSNLENPSASQLVFSLRLAQSLFRYTGLAVQYSGRVNFNEYDRSVAGLMYGYLAESQIFDDPMGYESSMIGSELTQLLPFQMMARFAGYYQKKKYVAQGIYRDQETFDETILRKDTYQTLWSTLGKRFNLPFSERTSLLLQFSYQWIKNDSNSYWYQYESQFFSLGIQLDI